MKNLILFCLFAFLISCKSTEVPLSTVDDSQSFIAVGTIANANDPYDMASAPVITKATVIRISTARAVKRHRLSYEHAKSMLACTDAVIDAVNKGYELKSNVIIAQADRLADQCKIDLEKFKGLPS